MGSLEYYTLVTQSQCVKIETTERFKKQTYRNRCYIRSSSGVFALVVPVHYHPGMQTKEVTIAQNQRWKKDHWGAIYSAYGKAPYFEYISAELHAILYRNQKFLIDLNEELISLAVKYLRLNVKVTCSEEDDQSEIAPYLNQITPKKSFSTRQIYQPVAYTQNFGENFEPNLSIIDLLMCEGPNGRQILEASFLRTSS